MEKAATATAIPFGKTIVTEVLAVNIVFVDYFTKLFFIQIQYPVFDISIDVFVVKRFLGR